MFTFMMLCRGLLLLLACWSALAAPPPGAGGHHEPAAGCSPTALIPCRNVSGGDWRLHLFRGPRVVCNYSCESDGERCEARSSCSDVKPHRSQDGKFSGFMVTPSQTPVTYRCDVTVIFPPPLRTTAGDSVVLVSVEGRQCGGGSAHDLDHTRSGRLWIWIVAVALLGIYSLAVTIVAWVFWVKLRRTEVQSDYMNTKPQQAKKRKGIQNPLPPRF